MRILQNLLQTLQDQDLGHLGIIAELWGFDPPEGPALPAAEKLARAMLDPQALCEIRQSLPLPAQEALDFINLRGGQIDLAHLARRFGPLRRMGPGRRDRLKPWRNPASPLETLWYRGLMALAFVDTSTGIQEFAFIPADLRKLLPKPKDQPQKPFGEPAESPASVFVGASAADDLTTLLAELRRHPSGAAHLSSDRRRGLIPFLLQPDSLDLLLVLAVENGALPQGSLRPETQAIRRLLDPGRPALHLRLIETWGETRAWNDLAHVPSLSAGREGWPNDPLLSRRQALGLLREIPPGNWWDLRSFIQDVFQHDPGFQRPAGDFDSWYLRHAESGDFLRGYQHWEAVEGAFLRFLICGPLFWLGMAELGAPAASGPISCFRLTDLCSTALGAGAPAQSDSVPSSVAIRSDGRIMVPRNAALALRYQISRFCAWEPVREGSYAFRLTPSALQHALDQGLRIEHILSILRKACGRPLPPHLTRALKRCAANKTEAAIERPTLLRVRDPDLMRMLRSNPAVSRFLGEPLGPTANLLAGRDIARLLEAAAKQGILLEPPRRGPMDPPEAE